MIFDKKTSLGVRGSQERVDADEVASFRCAGPVAVSLVLPDEGFGTGPGG